MLKAMSVWFVRSTIGIFLVCQHGKILLIMVQNAQCHQFDFGHMIRWIAVSYWSRSAAETVWHRSCYLDGSLLQLIWTNIFQTCSMAFWSTHSAGMVWVYGIDWLCCIDSEHNLVQENVECVHAIHAKFSFSKWLHCQYLLMLEMDFMIDFDLRQGIRPFSCYHPNWISAVQVTTDIAAGRSPKLKKWQDFQCLSWSSMSLSCKIPSMIFCCWIEEMSWHGQILQRSRKPTSQSRT